MEEFPISWVVLPCVMSDTILMSTGPVHTMAGTSESPSDRVAMQVKVNDSPAVAMAGDGLITTVGAPKGAERLQNECFDALTSQSM